jgi:ketosteroid isomerase-like protein
MQWLSTWEQAINARDFNAAKALFDDDVVGFGTLVEVVRGLDELSDAQWRRTWPQIEDFSFDTDAMSVATFGAGSAAAIAIMWRSYGLREDGSRYFRPGRATIVLKRHEDSAWRAVHTHFSLVPGEK